MSVLRTTSIFIAAMALQGSIALGADSPPEAKVLAVATENLPASVSGSAESAFLKKGIADFTIGNYEEALEALTKARQEDPTSSSAAYYLGAVKKKMQDYAGSLIDLKEAVALQPAVKVAFVDLADTYYALGRYDEALLALDVAERENIEPGQSAFLRGLVLAKQRRFADATVSFEKSKSFDPKLGTACEYQLASILQQKGELREARDRFMNVAGRDPDGDTGSLARQNAEALTKRLEGRRAFSASVGLQYLYDSNVILKPDIVSASTASISGETDISTIVTAQASFSPAIPHPYDVKFQYGFNMNKHQDLQEFDVMSHSLGATPTLRMGTQSLSAPVQYGYTLVDGEKYLTTLAVIPNWLFAPAEKQQAIVSFRYQAKDFEQPLVTDDEKRDATELAMGASWFWLLAEQKGFVNAKYEYNHEAATGNNWSYAGHRLGVNALYSVGDKWKLQAGAEAFQQDFDNPNTSFSLKKRQDRTMTYTAEARCGLSDMSDVQIQFVSIATDSTIDVYEFSKYTIGIGVDFRF